MHVRDRIAHELLDSCLARSALARAAMQIQRTAMVIALCALARPSVAEVTAENGDSYLDLNMLVQVQGRYVWSNGAGTTPDGAAVFFRRLRPRDLGAIDRNWYGIIEVDFGPGFEGEDPRRQSSRPIWSIPASKTIDRVR